MILLDTHVLIWWVNGDLEQLSAAALAAIDQASTGRQQGLLVSAISCWEVAMLVGRGRLALGIDSEQWLALVQTIPAVALLPLEPAVAIAAARLPEPFHPDPADRFLVAQARALGLPLVTADAKIRDYPHLKTLW